MSPASPESQQATDLRREGQVLFQRGLFAQAEEVVRRSLRLTPEDASAHNNLGAVLAAQGRHADALACFDDALRLHPDYLRAVHNRANALRELGRHDQALAAYDHALRLRPDSPDLLFDRSLTLLALSRFADAVPLLRDVIRQRPDHVDAHNRLAQVLAETGDLEGAAESYRTVLTHRPTSGEAHHNLGVIRSRQGRYSEALDCYQAEARLKPDDPASLNNLGFAFSQEGLLDEAIDAFRAALRLDPAYAEALNNLGITLGKRADFDASQAAFAEALRVRPGYAKAHANRAMAYLQQGDYPRGWPEYEWRWQTPDFTPRHFAQPRWDGSPLHGQSILLHTEQGLGDTLQFLRYAPLVQERGGVVLVEASARLLPLLGRFAGVDGLVARGQPLPDFTVQCPLLSLPALLGTTYATVPAAIPYLTPEPSLLRRWGERLRAVPGFKIGIAWQGSSGYRDDRNRSIPLRHFAPLAQVPGVFLVSLQKGPGSEQLAEVARGWNLLDLGAELDEKSGAFMDTAAVLPHLDLVICADTSLGHLAGALGLPVLLAMPFACDWRWPLNSDITPWYPCTRLFRQRRWGDWPEVFARLAEDVRSRLAPASLRRERAAALSPGALLDRIACLEVRRDQTTDLAERGRLCVELGQLGAARTAGLPPSGLAQELQHLLRALHAQLGPLEEQWRQAERAGAAVEQCGALARAVCRLRDQQADLRRRLDLLFGG